MIHPATEIRYINDLIGHGVFAKELIPAGTITWALDSLDREFTPQQVDAMEAFVQENFYTYTYRNSKGNFILLWDHTRYMNHSFEPNCMATAYGIEVAIRNISPGEQMTNDYGWLNILEPFTPLDEGTARKEVRPDDLLHFHQKWDQQFAAVLPLITQVKQPLWSLLDKKWDTLTKISSGKTKPKSILENYLQLK